MMKEKIFTYIPAKTSGIYVITNLKNNKKYVGSSKDIRTRLDRHFRDLRNNRHYNSS